MKTIQLTQSKFALVDDADFNRLNQWKWYAYKTGTGSGHWYAVRRIRTMGKQIACLMHRFILGIPTGIDVDHKNGNGLDNQRINLRPCSPTQNLQNIRKIWGLSKYKGVHWHKTAQKWQAAIRVNKKGIHLGLFSNELDAATAYNKAALKHFKEFACINNLKPELKH